MAIGQLFDYSRFHELPARLAVLLPHQPNPDGLALLQSAGIEAIWPHGKGFSLLWQRHLRLAGKRFRSRVPAGRLA